MSESSALYQRFDSNWELSSCKISGLKNELLAHKCFRLPLVIFFSVKTTLQIYAVQAKALSNSIITETRPSQLPNDVTMGGGPMVAYQLLE